MNITQAKKRLELAHERYCKEIESICAEVLESRVKPFCLERKTNFVSGMGGYAMWTQDDRSKRNPYQDRDYDESTAKSDRKWHSLRELLELPMEGMRDNCIGSYMDDFKTFEFTK